MFYPNTLKNILLKIIEQKPFDRKGFLSAKRKASSGQVSHVPDNRVLLNTYQNLLKTKEIKKNLLLEKLLQKRVIRTQSGIACITVMTKQYRCPGRCAFCPTEIGMPKSYLSNEPAMMRAVLNDFDPHRQVTSRLHALHSNGHPTDKVEIRIAGETWSAYPKHYQTWFIKRIFDALNEKRSLSLEESQHENETASNRCVGLSIETRPDWIHRDEIRRLRRLGVTLVELGVQHLDDKILQMNLRDHGVEAIKNATRLLRASGFKIVYHTMPNLYGSDLQSDFDMHQQLFTDSDFQPDQLKIYPCMLLKNTLLYRWHKEGKYQPYTTQELTELLLRIKAIVPTYVRIIRVIRDIPSTHIVAGNKLINLRQLLQKDPRYQCRCIRCREPKDRCFHGTKSRLKIISYSANDGMEYFISMESQDEKTIYGFVRLSLRVSSKHFLPELCDAALIRELHVYGMMVPLAKKSAGATQHMGIGQKLMREAETLAQKHEFRKIAVIAGVGVRKYYEQKLGYRLEGTYMVKKLLRSQE